MTSQPFKTGSGSAWPALAPIFNCCQSSRKSDLRSVVTFECVLLEQVQKKNFVENVIPMVIALKHMLEEKRLPVLKHLMAYLQVQGHRVIGQQRVHNDRLVGVNETRI